MNELKTYLGKEYLKWKDVKFDDSFAKHNCQTLEDVNAFYKQDITYLHRQMADLPTL